MLRTSSYTIYVDLPDTREEMLLVHGYTGAYDRVSRRVASYLRRHESKQAPKPLYGEWRSEIDLDGVTPDEPSPEVLGKLESRGYLTPLDPAQEEELFARLALKLHARAQAQTPSYVFMPTYDCNLRCSYCFQDHMRTDPKFGHLLRTIEPAMVDRYFAAIPHLEAHHGLEPGPRRREIGFFGGEPLLGRHRPLVERIMERGRELGEADFWAVTNGTELESYEDLLSPTGLGRLQITLDGPPEEHDRRRVYGDGSGSYERIARGIDLALDRGAVISVRLNIDRRNIAFLPALADEFVARGWSRRPNFSAYTAPVNAVNEHTERATTFNSWQLDQELTRLRQEHENLAVIGRPDESIRLRARQIFEQQKGLAPRLRPSFCGAHDQMYIFDPFGDVYACWEKTGEPGIRIAHVEEDATVSFEHALNREWRSRSVASNPVCKQCRYALHCGGGCAVLAVGQRGKFHANFCDGFASRFRASLADAFRAHQAGEEATHLHERVCDL